MLLVPKDILARLGAGPGSGAFARLEGGDLSPLQDCPFLLASTKEINGEIGYSLLRRSGVVPVPKVESYNSTVKTQLILAALGAGACFCPQNMVHATLTPQQRDRLQVFRLGEEGRCMIQIGYLKQAYPWSVITNFIRLAQEMSGEFEAKK